MACMDTLGIDIGNVIVAGQGPGDTSFSRGDPLQTPALPGAFDAIAQLAAGRFAGRVHLISKAYPNMERRTRLWLAAQDFARITGVAEECWHFVRERPEKGPLCARLGITHFVDDKLENLGHARDHGTRHLLLFGGEAASGDWFTHAPDWAAVLSLLAA